MRPLLTALRYLICWACAFGIVITGVTLFPPGVPISFLLGAMAIFAATALAAFWDEATR